MGRILSSITGYITFTSHVGGDLIEVVSKYITSRDVLQSQGAELCKSKLASVTKYAMGG